MQRNQQILANKATRWETGNRSHGSKQQRKTWKPTKPYINTNIQKIIWRANRLNKSQQRKVRQPKMRTKEKKRKKTWKANRLKQQTRKAQRAKINQVPGGGASHRADRKRHSPTRFKNLLMTITWEQRTGNLQVGCSNAAGRELTWFGAWDGARSSLRPSDDTPAARICLSIMAAAEVHLSPHLSALNGTHTDQARLMASCRCDEYRMWCR